MGDVMLFGVLRMPYDMAMADEYTRYQYHQRGLQAANAIESLQAQLAEARDLLKHTLPALTAAHDTHIMALGRNPDDYDSKFRRAAAAIRAMKGERG